MFKKIIEAIRLLFSSLFGGSKKNHVQVEKEALTDAPQDAAEVKPDTIVIVANETEPVIIPPGDTSEEFDSNLFEDTTEPETPVTPSLEENPETPAPSESETTDSTATDSPEEPAEPTPDVPTHTPRYLWCLDNGHGSQTAGKRSPVFDDGETQLLEYRFNRDIVARIITKLDEIGVKHFNVVPEVDIDNFLKGRVERANSKKSDLPKIFVSVHANAASAESSQHWAADNVKGIETWHYHNSKKGKKLASVFQKHLIEKTGFKSRHIKSKANKQFYVLRKTKMVSILTENGFYNNKKEATELMKDEVRQQIADAHVAAILEIEASGV